MTLDIFKIGFSRLDTFVRVAVIHSVAVTLGKYEPGCASAIRFRKCATGRCRTQHDKVMTRHDTYFSVASGIHTSAFAVRSLHCGPGQHASDLRVFMVLTRDIHEANSSLETLHLRYNQISDEGATALAQALKARLVVCS